jgi:hypothetical protein
MQRRESNKRIKGKRRIKKWMEKNRKEEADKGLGLSPDMHTRAVYDAPLPSYTWKENAERKEGRNANTKKKTRFVHQKRKTIENQ